MPVVPLLNYAWPSGLDWPVALLRGRLPEWAEAGGWPLQRWEEDGWGPAQGIALRLPTGRVVLLVEYQHQLDRGDWPGPNVTADAADVAKYGPRVIVQELLREIGLADVALVWLADRDSCKGAAKYLPDSAEPEPL